MKNSGRKIINIQNMKLIHHFLSRQTYDATYLTRPTGDAHYVFGVEARQSFRLLLIGEECVKVL